MVGTTLGTVIHKNFGYQGVFYGLASVYFFNFILLLIFLKEEESDKIDDYGVMKEGENKIKKEEITKFRIFCHTRTAMALLALSVATFNFLYFLSFIALYM